MTSVRAFAPASVANVAVGFDLLGFSFGVTGDTVTVEKTDSKEIVVENVSGVVTRIPSDAKQNTATAGLLQLQKDFHLNFGFRVSIEKGIPLGSGMGGSAASAVGAIVAANALLPKSLSKTQLLNYALIGEGVASGSYHADNIAPCLLGGLTLARVTSQKPEVEVTEIPIPSEIHAVVILPELSVATKEARGILQKEIPFKAHIAQSANLAGFISGCFTNDYELIARSLKDTIVEPQREHLIPGFAKVKEAALKNAALGCSIAGAGPSVFAWARGKTTADNIQKAMIEAFNGCGVKAKGWAVSLKRDGAKVL